MAAAVRPGDNIAAFAAAVVRAMFESVVRFCRGFAATHTKVCLAPANGTNLLARADCRAVEIPAFACARIEAVGACVETSRGILERRELCAQAAAVAVLWRVMFDAVRIVERKHFRRSLDVVFAVAYASARAFYFSVFLAVA